MGIERVSLLFDSRVPELETIVAEAQQLGGLRIDVLDSLGTKDMQGFRDIPGMQLETTRVAFSDCPDGIVRITTEPKLYRISVSNHTGVAPVLYRLLSHTLIRMGGQSAGKIAPLRLPLTIEFVESYTQNYRKQIDVGMASIRRYIIWLIVAIVVGLLGFGIALWAAWRAYVA